MIASLNSTMWDIQGVDSRFWVLSPYAVPTSLTLPSPLTDPNPTCHRWRQANEAGKPKLQLLHWRSCFRRVWGDLNIGSLNSVGKSKTLQVIPPLGRRMWRTKQGEYCCLLGTRSILVQKIETKSRRNNDHWSLRNHMWDSRSAGQEAGAKIERRKPSPSEKGDGTWRRYYFPVLSSCTLPYPLLLSRRCLAFITAGQGIAYIAQWFNFCTMISDRTLTFEVPSSTQQQTSIVIAKYFNQATSNLLGFIPCRKSIFENQNKPHTE